jgi:hypothetical protein
MTGRIAPISNSRQVKELHQNLGSLRVYASECITEGCGISPFFKAYADRVLKNGHKENPLLTISRFEWLKGSRKRQGISDFSILGWAPDNQGVFFSIKRSVKEELPWCKHHSLGVLREVHAIIAERLKYRTPACSQTNVVLGDTIKQLISMGKMLISFKIDNGIHLVFKEALRSNRCLEVYIGGWFNEVQYPLTDYKAFKHNNPLRQEPNLAKDLNHGPNKCAAASLSGLA